MAIQIWIEALPFEVQWSDEAIYALQWSIQSICDQPELNSDVITGMVDPSAVSVKAELIGTGVDLTQNQKLKISRAISNFLRFHNHKDISSEKSERSLENGLSVIFVYDKFDVTIDWEEIYNSL